MHDNGLRRLCASVVVAFVGCLARLVLAERVGAEHGALGDPRDRVGGGLAGIHDDAHRVGRPLGGLGPRGATDAHPIERRALVAAADAEKNHALDLEALWCQHLDRRSRLAREGRRRGGALETANRLPVQPLADLSELDILPDREHDTGAQWGGQRQEANLWSLGHQALGHYVALRNRLSRRGKRTTVVFVLSEP